MDEIWNSCMWLKKINLTKNWIFSIGDIVIFFEEGEIIHNLFKVFFKLNTCQGKYLFGLCYVFLISIWLRLTLVSPCLNRKLLSDTGY